MNSHQTSGNTLEQPRRSPVRRAVVSKQIKKKVRQVKGENDENECLYSEQQIYEGLMERSPVSQQETEAHKLLTNFPAVFQTVQDTLPLGTGGGSARAISCEQISSARQQAENDDEDDNSFQRLKQKYSPAIENAFGPWHTKHARVQQPYTLYSVNPPSYLSARRQGTEYGELSHDGKKKTLLLVQQQNGSATQKKRQLNLRDVMHESTYAKNQIFLKQARLLTEPIIPSKAAAVPVTLQSPITITVESTVTSNVTAESAKKKTSFNASSSKRQALKPLQKMITFEDQKSTLHTQSSPTKLKIPFVIQATETQQQMGKRVNHAFRESIQNAIAVANGNIVAARSRESMMDLLVRGSASKTRSCADPPELVVTGVYSNNNNNNNNNAATKALLGGLRSTPTNLSGIQKELHNQSQQYIAIVQSRALQKQQLVTPASQLAIQEHSLSEHTHLPKSAETYQLPSNQQQQLSEQEHERRNTLPEDATNVYYLKKALARKTLQTAAHDDSALQKKSSFQFKGYGATNAGDDQFFHYATKDIGNIHLFKHNLLMKVKGYRKSLKELQTIQPAQATAGGGARSSQLVYIKERDESMERNRNSLTGSKLKSGANNKANNTIQMQNQQQQYQYQQQQPQRKQRASSNSAKLEITQNVNAQARAHYFGMRNAPIRGDQQKQFQLLLLQSSGIQQKSIKNQLPEMLTPKNITFD